MVLLHGEDVGLIRSRAEAVVAAVAGSVDDPFRVTDLEQASASELAIAAASLSLTGGRPVVRVRHATDAAADAVRSALTGPAGATMVLEAAGLPSRSRLRQLVEGADLGASIACYPVEGRDLERSLEQAFAERGLAVDREVLQWLSREGAADHGQLGQMVEMLALYGGENGRIDLGIARDCLGTGSNLSLDDALFAATEGDVGGCDRALALVGEGGQSGPTIIRAAISHLQRLLRVRYAIDAGASSERAISALRPPLFWRQQIPFKHAIEFWGADSLLRFLDHLQEAERLSKQTGAPAEAVCRQAISAIATEAAAARQGANATRSAATR